MPDETTPDPLAGEANPAQRIPPAANNAKANNAAPDLQRLMADLTQAGLSPRAAESWTQLRNTHSRTSLVALAMAWNEAGIDADAAVAWSQLDGWSPQDALPWYLVGYTPDEAEMCDWLIFKAEQRQPQGETPSTVDEWLGSGLPPRTVVRALTIGVITVDRAGTLHEVTTANRELGGTLDLLRAIALSRPDDMSG